MATCDINTFKATGSLPPVCNFMQFSFIIIMPSMNAHNRYSYLLIPQKGKGHELPIVISSKEKTHLCALDAIKNLTIKHILTECIEFKEQKEKYLKSKKFKKNY